MTMKTMPPLPQGHFVEGRWVSDLPERTWEPPGDEFGDLVLRYVAKAVVAGMFLLTLWSCSGALTQRNDSIEQIEQYGVMQEIGPGVVSQIVPQEIGLPPVTGP